ncbi:ABC transporter permease [Falsarthrobacter nasiphocae]|uniref:Transport permease protein n=1 Tax=Falsarthrobacter nasiphocae TaxID=189863 RepID=A0AAE4C5T3_9MICC|nr:ABC transporter permease [Falsarthrobacter nasiphocae]MDR6891412.1 ABC-2 type transport system permease protein [Falsarthrobacter nasiphocae]
MTVAEAPAVQPGRGRGLRDVVTHRFLLRLLVRKEIQVRYRGSVLGILWSYIKPGVQFLVYYIAMGKFLKLDHGSANYAIYLFSGIIIINFFSEAFGNGARSIVANSGLIRKIYLPRQLFPISTVWVATVHFLPQILILLLASLVAGWRPGPLNLVSIVLGFLIVALFSAGMGLLFACANVFFRDSENIVDMIIMVATWTSPVLYMTDMAKNAMPAWLFSLYSSNPLTVAVQLFHHGFWDPTVEGSALPPDLYPIYLPIALALSVATIVLGDLAFRKTEGDFAQEL